MSRAWWLLVGLALGALLPRPRPATPEPRLWTLAELEQRVDLLTCRAAGIEDVYADRIRRTGNPAGKGKE